ncbi:MAG TPA: hypothetical protein DEA08_05565 [Planctomycetes bacterium]|nr:hypothetical protein [Planctomycetota bacterium]|tara:strand:- start:106 stop:483 length:378 start_codon:yes stop_codon:yes gene_type:complete
MRLLLLLVLLAQAGCTIGREYVGGQLGEQQLEQLATLHTKAEVLEVLGPPNDMGLQLRESVFLYRVQREAAENLNLSFFRASFDYQQIDRRTDRLIVFFDKGGRVTRYGLDLASEEAEDEGSGDE